MNEQKILLVDDESYILFSLRRFFRQNHIMVDVESDSVNAIQRIKENHYQVIISDFQMPNMNGLEFLELVKEISPQSIRMVLSAYINQDILPDLINRSEIFRLITKPAKENDLLNAVKECIHLYNLNSNLKNSKESSEEITLNNNNEAPKVLRDDYFAESLWTDTSKANIDSIRQDMHQSMNYLINLNSSKIGLHCKRVAQLSAFLAKSLGLDDLRLKNIYYAGLYHDIGKIFELRTGTKHDEIGMNILNQFQELKDSALIIQGHHLSFQSEGGASQSDETKILHLVDYFDKEITKEFSQELGEKAKTLTEIFGTIEKLKGIEFDPKIVDVFLKETLKNFQLENMTTEDKIHFIDLKEGMVLSRPLFNVKGKILLNSEFLITQDVIERLYRHHQGTNIQSPIFIYAKKPDKVFNFDEMILNKVKIKL